MHAYTYIHMCIHSFLFVANPSFNISKSCNNHCSNSYHNSSCLCSCCCFNRRGQEKEKEKRMGNPFALNPFSFLPLFCFVLSCCFSFFFSFCDSPLAFHFWTPTAPRLDEPNRSVGAGKRNKTSKQIQSKQ